MSEQGKMTIFASVQKFKRMGHLTKEQRYTIFVMKQQGCKINFIASAIGKDKSVVSRELKRNCDKRSGQYNVDLAQRKYQKRMQKKQKKSTLLKLYVNVLKNYSERTSVQNRSLEDANWKDWNVLAMSVSISIYGRIRSVAETYILTCDAKVGGIENVVLPGTIEVSSVIE